MTLANDKIKAIAEVAQIAALIDEFQGLKGISPAASVIITATLTAEINAAADFAALEALQLGTEEAVALTNTLFRFADESTVRDQGRMSPFGGAGTLQNLLLQSEEVADETVWTDPQTNTTGVSDNATAPDDTQTADTITWDTVGLGLRQLNIGTVASNPYTLSFWGRSVSGNDTLNFDVRDGTTMTVTLTSTFERHTVFITAGVAGADFLDVSMLGTVGVVEFWGMQLVDGSEELPYTKTTDTQALAVTQGLSVPGTVQATNVEADSVVALTTMTFNGNPVSSQSATSVVDIFSNADWPATVTGRDGNTRVPLSQGVTYVIHNLLFGLPLMELPLGVVGAGTINLVGAANANKNILISGSANVGHFWGRSAPTLQFANLIMIDIAGGGRGTKLLDLGAGDVNAFVTFEGGALVNFKSLGDLVDVDMVAQTELGVVGCEGGFVQRFTGTYDVAGSGFRAVYTSSGSPPTPTLKPQLVMQGAAVMSILGGSIGMVAGDPIYHIDSAYTGSSSISTVGYSGASAGDFFRSDVSALALSGEANVDKSITSFAADAKTITTVTDAFGTATYGLGTSNRHEWLVGDSVTHSGFTEGSYNGVKTIASVTEFTYTTGDAFVAGDTGTATNDLATVVASTQAGFTRGQIVLLGGATPGAYSGLQTIKSVAFDEDSFIIPVAFSVGGTGDIKITRVTTSSDHPMVTGETHTIAGTTSYNGTSAILFTTTDDSFDIPVAFVADEGATGDVSSTGLDETDILVSVANNGAQKDSKSIGSVVAVGNTVVTTIVTINTFTDLNLNALAVAGSNIELWSSVNATTTELTYIGLADFSGGIKATLSCTSAGGSQNFQFQVFVNGVVTTDAVPSSVDLSSAPMVPVPVIAPVQCVTGDVVRIRVQNTSGTADVLVQDLSIEIQ